jgi:replicative DNA helicase
MTRDLNDRFKDGDMPDDPKDICIPINDAARLYDDKNPRIRTVRQLLQASQKRSFRTGKPKALTTCHAGLDAITGGIRPGKVWVFGAETNWGKTAWVVAVADENMARGARVLIAATEDTEDIYGDRLMARRARVSATHIRDWCLTRDEHQKIAQVVSDAPPDPIFIDAIGVPVERLVVQISNAIEKHRIDLVCLDYIQELKTDLKFQDERVKFREMASMFRVMVKRHRIAGIITSQLTIPEGKTEPNKGWIRECKDIPNAAEVVALGYVATEESKDKDGNILIHIGERVVKIDKCKDGQKGRVEMSWDENAACFNRTLKRIEGYDDFIGFEPDDPDSRLPPESDPLSSIPPAPRYGYAHENPPHPATPDRDDYDPNDDFGGI